MDSEFVKESEHIEDRPEMESGLVQPDRAGKLGKSLPMDDVFSTDFSFIAAHYCQGTDPMKHLKFIHIPNAKLLGKFVILIFMDNNMTEIEIDEWMAISNNLDLYK